MDQDSSAENSPDEAGPLLRRTGWQALRRTASEFREDNVTDLAAALTYYAVLSVFPALLALFSVVGLLGSSARNELRSNLESFTPGPARDIVSGAIDQLTASQGSAGILLVLGLAGALWSASGYVSAFMRAANAIWDVREGRPIWKTLPVRLGVTAVVGVLLVLSAGAVVLTGAVAEKTGQLLGLGSTFVTVWDVAKWPVLLVVVWLVFSILYYACPNVRHPGFRWVTPGSGLAVLLVVVASAGFALYVATFASYNKTYGSVAGVIVFLVWLWLSNVALLFGAEFDAELERGRHMAEGHPADDEPYVDLRDSRNLGTERSRTSSSSAQTTLPASRTS
ncbi:MAG TPA: YihY/virulence factor BrkB family protein [Mycobacteriales bacterium]|nr:YihY/virulence factor BrkB family protein [Mycobacteriales bacterium]